MGVYIPWFNALDDQDRIHALIEQVGSAELITVGADGFPLATLLPVLWPGDRLVFHMARANPHWRAIEPGSPALAVVSGPAAYISPTWYESKAEHGRVVPTWNYLAVQFRGRATVHTDPAWLRTAVTELTDRHERPRPHPWSVEDAPERYIDGQLRAIVGIEVAIESVEAKAKLSQNRSEQDRAGVVAGLRADGGPRGLEVAAAMETPR